MAKGDNENVIEALAGLFILNLRLRKTEIEEHSAHIEYQRKRIQSYSALFDPKQFLTLSRGGSTMKKLSLQL